MKEDDDAFSKAGRTGFERPDDYLSPSTTVKPRVRRATDISLGAKIDAFQNSISPSTNTRKAALPFTNNSSSHSTSSSGSGDRLSKNLKPPLVTFDHSTSSSGSVEHLSKSLKPPLGNNSSRKPRVKREDSAEFTETAVSSDVLNASFSSGGYSGYGRPDDFVGSPAQRGSKRRSWRPKAAVESITGFSTPTADTSKGKITLSMSVPNSAPATTSTTNRVNGVQSLRQLLKPPLGSTTPTQSQPKLSLASSGRAAFHHPDDYVGSPKMTLRRSWMTSKEVNSSAETAEAASDDGNHDSAIFVTPEPEDKGKVAVPSDSVGLPVAAPRLSPKTEDTETSSPRRHTINSEGLPPRPVCANDNDARRASAPPDVLLDATARPTTPGSNPSPRRWSRKVDPSLILPPAFRAAHPSDAVDGAKLQSPHIRHFDPSKLERVVHQQLTLSPPGKLKRKWPPVVSDKSSAPDLSHSRASGVVPEETVVARRSNFEHALEEETLGVGALPIVRRKQESSLLGGEAPLNQPVTVSPGSCVSEMTFDDSKNNNILSALANNDGLSALPLPLDDDGSVDRWGRGRSAALAAPKRHVRAQTSMRIRWGGPTFYDIEGRPLYYDEVFVDEEGNVLPFAPLLADRFGRSSKSRDSAPMAPLQRRFDAWSDDESCYTEDEKEEEEVEVQESAEEEGVESQNRKNGRKRPDVWVTPMDGDENAASTSFDEPNKWRVKRVWNIAEIDEREKEHSVEDKDLMKKVKTLLGVPIEAEVVSRKYDPAASNWKVMKVYDLDGIIKDSGKTRTLDEEGMLVDFTDVADGQNYQTVQSGDVNEEKSTQTMEDGSDLNGTEHTDSSDLNGTDHTNTTDRTIASTMDGSGLLCEDSLIEDRESAATAGRSSAADPRKGEDFTCELPKETSEATKKTVQEKKEKKKKKKGKRMSIADLLSPPSITLFQSASEHSIDLSKLI